MFDSVISEKNIYVFENSDVSFIYFILGLFNDAFN